MHCTHSYTLWEAFKEQRAHTQVSRFNLPSHMDYYLQIYGAYDSAIDNLLQAQNHLKQNQKRKWY